MVASNQISPGMILNIGKKLYRVESSVKVTVTKGANFVKTKLRDLNSESVLEKNFKFDQTVKDVALQERTLEFLYVEGKNYSFLDIGSLENFDVPKDIVGGAVNFLKEGIQLIASFYGDNCFAVELPQFLELMVASTDGEAGGSAPVANTAKQAVLETGARVEVPPFIEAGDIIKVDTKSSAYIQRV